MNLVVNIHAVLRAPHTHLWQFANRTRQVGDQRNDVAAPGHVVGGLQQLRCRLQFLHESPHAQA